MTTATIKAVSITANNFMRLRAVEVGIAPGGITHVVGRNAQGKSSVLNAIAAALGGGANIPDRPIRKGAKAASIVLETTLYTVTRTFTDSGGTTLTITAKDGSKISKPQMLLDTLYADLAFDPMAFNRLKPQDQVAAVLRATGKGKELEAIDNLVRDLQRSRLLTGRDRDQARARMGTTPPEPATRVNVADLVNQRQMAIDANATNQNARETISRVIKGQADAIERIAALKAEITTLQAKIDEAEAWINRYPKAEDIIDTDLAPYTQAIADADRTNAAATNYDLYLDAKATFEMHDKDYKKYDRELDEAAQAKEKLLGESSLKVSGLTFTEDGLRLNGVEYAQASTSEQIRASVAIALATNPALKIILVRDGSLLDADALATLEAIAADQGAQIIMEQVGSKVEGCGVIIEDGEVQA